MTATTPEAKYAKLLALGLTPEQADSALKILGVLPITDADRGPFCMSADGIDAAVRAKVVAAARPDGEIDRVNPAFAARVRARLG